MNHQVFRYLTLFSQFFFNMIVPIAGCFALGWWIDQKLNTSYWVVILFLVGALAGLTNIVRFGIKMASENEKKRGSVKRYEDTGEK